MICSSVKIVSFRAVIVQPTVATVFPGAAPTSLTPTTYAIGAPTKTPSSLAPAVTPTKQPASPSSIAPGNNLKHTIDLFYYRHRCYD